MKTILVPFRDDATAQAALDLACRVSNARGARIEGLFIQTAPLVYASEGIAIGGYVTQLADEEQRRGDEARARFVERQILGATKALKKRGARRFSSIGWTCGDQKDIIVLCSIEPFPDFRGAGAGGLHHAVGES